MFRSILNAIAFSVLIVAPVFADDLAAPKGDVLLTVTGDLKVTNVGRSVQLDLELLEGFESTSFDTATIWTEGVQTFTGVSLYDLVEKLGISATALQATAINDYAVEIPITDAIEGGAIIAYRMNEKTMSVRDKGPLWIVYPYDDNEIFRTEVIYSRSIWQLDRISAIE